MSNLPTFLTLCNYGKTTLLSLIDRMPVCFRGPPWQGGYPWEGVSLAEGSPWQGGLLGGGLLGRGSSPLQGVSLARGSPWQGVSLAGGGGIPACTDADTPHPPL